MREIAARIIENAMAKETLKLNQLGKYIFMDRITLFVQFWLNFANKTYFQDQTVKSKRRCFFFNVDLQSEKKLISSDLLPPKLLK